MAVTRTTTASSTVSAAGAVLLLLCLSAARAQANLNALERINSKALFAKLQDAGAIAAYGQPQQHGQLARRLLGSQAALQFFTMQAQCSWDDSAPAGDQCIPLLSNFYMIKGEPSSAYRRSQLMSLDRAKVCDGYKTQDTCYKDQANRCYWWVSKDGKDQECRNADYNEVRYFDNRNFTVSAYTVPAAMTCPGSKAAEFYACFAGPDQESGCKRLSNCWLANIDNTPFCLPKWMQSYNQQQFEQLFDGLAAVDDKLYGSCAGACWLKQARACLQATASGKVGCEKLSYCWWDGAACTRSTFELTTDYDKKVAALYGACYRGKTQKDCEATYTSKARAESSIDWKKYTPSAEAVQCKL